MISLIAAVAKNGVIGNNNDLLWHIPEDLQHFKKLTTGATVIMGRKTFDSIYRRINKPLPNRTNVIITRQTNIKLPEGVIVCASIEDALRTYGGNNIFIIGGGEIYRQTINLADRLYITNVEKEYAGDVSFPAIDPARWNKVSDEPHEGFSFAVYERK